MVGTFAFVERHHCIRTNMCEKNNAKSFSAVLVVFDVDGGGLDDTHWVSGWDRTPLDLGHVSITPFDVEA